MRHPLAAAFLICLTGPGFAESIDLSVENPQIQLDFSTDPHTPKARTLSEYQFGGALVEPRVRLGISADEDRRAAYASAGFDTGFGEIGLGRPRSILDAGPLPSGAPGVPPSLRPLAAEAALNEELGAGLRVAGSRGAISFGTSYHTIEESSDAVVGVAGRFDVNALTALDNIALFGGAESSGDDQRFRLGTEVTRGITTAGVDLVRSNEDEGRTLSQVYIGLAVTPNVSLGVSGLRDTFDATDTTDTRFGLGASVATENGTFFRGGVDGVTSDDPAFEVSVGFEF